MIAALDDGYALHELVAPGSYRTGTFSETLLALRQQRWRELIESIVRADFERLGGDPPMSVEAAAAMISALDDGYALHELVEPGSYRTGTLSETLLTLRRMWQAGSAPSTPPKRRTKS